MARIRSIHPGFWTDETFAALSDAAALFYVGLLNEADDNGLFEWKPLTLRMRLRPTKDGDVDTLLAELAGRDVIRRYETAGRPYGAVRNFCRYQKPKFPKAVHPMTDAIRAYTGSAHAIPGIDGDDAPLFPRPAETGGDQRASVRANAAGDGDGAAPIPRNAESGVQREEGEGVGVGIGVGAETGSRREPSAAAAGSARAGRHGSRGRAAVADAGLSRHWLDGLEAECRAAAGLAGAPEPGLADLSPIVTLIERGYDLARDILPKLRAASAAGRRGRTWAYYVPGITEGEAANARIPAKAAAAPGAAMRWVLHDSAAWAGEAARYRALNGREPPRVAGLGGMGWHFPAAPPAAGPG